MGLSYHDLPIELCLKIVGEALQSVEDRGLVGLSPDRTWSRFHSVRMNRLATFRSIARSCKALLDPARTVFWEEIGLLSISDFASFSRMITKGEAKPACIRRFYIRLSDNYMVDQEYHNSKKMESEARHHLSIILHILPVHLEKFHVTCAPTRRGTYHEVLYEGLRTARAVHAAWSIDVSHLNIAIRHGHRDIFPHFAFIQNVRHLALTVTYRDDIHTFKTPSSLKDLDSLVVGLEFGDSETRDAMSSAMKAAAEALKPACTSLQSLTLELCGLGPFNCPPIEVMLSLNSSSVTVLHLRATPSTIFFPQVESLVPKFPALPRLQHLKVDGIGLNPKIFKQLGCMDLKELNVPMTASTLGCIVDSVMLPELANIEVVTIGFNGGFGEHLFRDPTGPAATLKRVCDSRNITLLIFACTN